MYDCHPVRPRRGGPPRTILVKFSKGGNLGPLKKILANLNIDYLKSVGVFMSRHQCKNDVEIHKVAIKKRADGIVAAVKINDLGITTALKDGKWISLRTLFSVQRLTGKDTTPPKPSSLGKAVSKLALRDDSGMETESETS